VFAIVVGLVGGCDCSPKGKWSVESENPLIAVERVRFGKTIPASHTLYNSPVASLFAEYDNPTCSYTLRSARGIGEVMKLQRFVGGLFAECGKIAGAAWGLYTNRIDNARDGVDRVCGNLFRMYEDSRGGFEPEKDRISCSWEVCLDGRKVWEDSRYISYRIRCETYFGGAHPDIQIVNGVYDRRSERRLKAEDIIKEDSLLSVLNLLRMAIAGANPDSSILSCLSDPETRPYSALRRIRVENEADTSEWTNIPFLTENFYLDENGITWTFDEYELSSYGDGCPEGTVSWKDLEKHLKDTSIIPLPLAPRSEFWEKLKSSESKEVGGLIFF